MDARGRPLALAVLPGQRSGLSAAWLRAAIAALGAEPCIPAQPTHPPVAYDTAAYARRNRVERFWARAKEWRGVAARYDKTAACHAAGVAIAATFDWLKG